jgi:hypothetical protein
MVHTILVFFTRIASTVYYMAVFQELRIAEGDSEHRYIFRNCICVC